MSQNQTIGKLGEELATQYLKKIGVKIIERNFSCRQGEIDIIGKESEELVFIEVKTRSNLKYGNPADAVGYRKQQHLKQAIKYYLYKNNIINVPVRIDVIEIYIKQKSPKINQIKQIF